MYTPNAVNPMRNPRRLLPLLVACLALAWFALGSALNVMVASASGKQIEIVVCSGAGVKKIMVSADTDDLSTTIKHCGNAPVVTYLIIPGEPVHLQFKAPRTVASWQWIPNGHVQHDLVQDNKPPPGRAPPAALLG